MDDMAAKRQAMEDHMKGHITYPASKQDIMEACNMMSDVPEKVKQYVAEHLPEGSYQSVDEVKEALMPKEAD